jgi:hypothetical protein
MIFVHHINNRINILMYKRREFIIFLNIFINQVYNFNKKAFLMSSEPT